MRHLRLSGMCVSIALVLCLCTGSALANSTVNVLFTGTGGNSAGGVYTYPYYLSINGGFSLVVICDSYDNEVTTGETWQANVVSLLSGAGLFGGQLLDYKAAGLIFKSILNGTLTNVSAANFAIWGLFSTNAQSNPYFTSSGAAGIETTYLALAAVAPNSAFSGLVLYTPIAGTQSSGGTPQEYMGVVPEPGSLVLFGTGLLSLAGLARRKLGRV